MREEIPMRQEIPIVKINENLIVSFLSDIDDISALKLKSELLHRIHEGQITGVLIDLTVLDIVDFFLGRLISDIARSSAILDANTVVVGIQPAVAITLVELGLELEGTIPALNVEDGIELLNELRKVKYDFGDINEETRNSSEYPY